MLHVLATPRQRGNRRLYGGSSPAVSSAASHHIAPTPTPQTDAGTGAGTMA
ncbi:hypothetical protein LQL77_29940 [Rhodococcus cerastii]|nr:hypothetical protein [Rhodococcus cerastii]